MESPGTPPSKNPLVALSEAATLRGVHLMAVFLFLGVFVLGEYILLKNQLATHVWADGFWTLSSLLAAWRCLSTARQASGRDQAAWTFFGAGCLSWFFGMLAWDYYELVEQVVTPFPAISDFGFMGFAPLFLIGGIFYSSHSPTAGDTLRHVFNLGLIICATIIGAIIILYDAVVTSTESVLYLTAALAYPVLYVSALLFGLSWLLLRLWGEKRKVYLLLLGGLAVHTVVDTLYAFSLLGRTYEAGHFLDPFWVVGFALFYWAGVEEAARPHPADEKPILPSSFMPGRQSLLPGIALLGALILALIFRETLDPGALSLLLPFAVAFAVLLILGEWGTNRMERRLARAITWESARAQRYLDTAQIMLVALDREGHILKINRKGARLLGRSDNELTGLAFAASFLLEEDRAAFQDFQRRVMSKGDLEGEEVEVRLRPNNGEEKILTVQASATFDEDGAVDGALFSAEDITARKHAEQELMRSNQDLEQFAYLASHDLQEPLRMIASYMKLVSRRFGDKLDGEALEFIGFAEDGAKRMSALIHDLLQYSRVQRQGVSSALVSSEMAARTALAMLAREIEITSAEVVMGDLPVVRADKTLLSLVFQNLIGNALKYRSPERTPKIRVRAARQGKIWVFSIQDNGIGIDAQYFDRIFGIFQRLHRREDVPGTGIGLSLVQKITERLGGRVWLDSKVGEGTTFHFTIPAADETVDVKSKT
ncbi:MAG: hypothetical protein A2516_02630 [Alphaproteobacteria bacterium RIFOXYD12_FULL_60_8]|nr:MAG: hypothetical protein A2516_02630 [Alphaproteobacteria bacterium RIFOXYD12_FULL_60_8]